MTSQHLRNKKQLPLKEHSTFRLILYGKHGQNPKVLKNGGALNSMKGPDGKEIWSTGTYKEISPREKIVYTNSFADSTGKIVPASVYKMPGEWALELIVTLTFEEMDGKTNMTLRHAGVPLELSDDCIKGWQSSFDKLERNVN